MTTICWGHQTYQTGERSATVLLRDNTTRGFVYRSKDMGEWALLVPPLGTSVDIKEPADRLVKQLTCIVAKEVDASGTEDEITRNSQS